MAGRRDVPAAWFLEPGFTLAGRPGLFSKGQATTPERALVLAGPLPLAVRLRPAPL
jgi:hypothetical protein